MLFYGDNRVNSLLLIMLLTHRIYFRHSTTFQKVYGPNYIVYSMINFKIVIEFDKV